MREVASGAGTFEAWKLAFPNKSAEVSPQAGGGHAQGLMNSRRIKIWLDYLSEAKPEQLIEDKYLESIAFGTPKDSMRAAENYLESQFAGKEVAEIFLKVLQEIQAEIVVPFEGRLDRVTL